MSVVSLGSPPPTTADLEVFVFHPDKYRADKVPRRLQASDVAQFMAARLNASTELRPLQQAEKVITFYDVQEVVPQLQEMMQKISGSASVQRSLVVDRTIARIGTARDVQFAGQQYARLIPQVSSLQELEDALGLYSALGNTVNAAPMQQQITARLSAVRGRAEADHEAHIEYSKLEEFNNIKFARAQKANAAKQQITSEPNRQKRIHNEISIYLSLGNYGYSEFLQPWAADRLRRETWGQQPEQQEVRSENPALRKELAQIFHQASATLEQTPKILKENIPSLRVRCLRAVDFFGGHLSAQEITYVRQHAGMQADVLSNE